MSTNWLLALGVPFDPLPTEAELANLLDVREREWSLKANRSEQGAYYNAMLGRFSTIRNDLAQPHIRTQLATEARQIAYPIIDQLIASAADPATAKVDPSKEAQISRLAHDMISSQTGIAIVELPGDLISSRVRAFNASSGNTGASSPANTSGDPAALYRSFAATKPDGFHKFRTMDADLALFGASDLFEYALEDGRRWNTASFISSTEISERIKARIGRYGMATPDRSAAERLYSRCREVFASDAERNRYLSYLQWRDSIVVLDQAGKFSMLSNGSLPADQIEVAVGNLTALLNDSGFARRLLEGYCADKGIILAVGGPPVGPSVGGGAAVGSAVGAIGGATVGPVGGGPAVGTFGGGPAVGTFGTAVGPAGTADDSPYGPPHLWSGDDSRGKPSPIENDSPWTLSSGLDRIRCTYCGESTAADGMYCEVCGKPIGFAPIKQTVVGSTGSSSKSIGSASSTPPSSERRTSKNKSQNKQGSNKTSGSHRALIVAIALIVLLALGGLAAYLITSHSNDTEESSANSAVVPSTSVLTCDSHTRITPVDEHQSPLQRYRIELFDSAGESLMMLNVDGTGGFSMLDFIDYDDSIGAGNYRIALTDTDSGEAFQLSIDYQGRDSNAAKSIEVQCQ